jgi:acetylglutamate kinase
MGFSGADGNLIKAEKREISDIDYGFVGDVEAESINFQLLESLLDLNLVPVFSAITHDQKGQLFNTNADSIASVLAQALRQNYNVELLYCFDRNGVLENPNDSASVIKNLNIEKYEELKAAQKLTEGILPKLKNAFLAKENQVAKVFLLNESNLQNHINQENDGTEIKK